MMKKNVFWFSVAVALCMYFATNAAAKNPKVLFLGDSITMHYSPTVIELMDGKADVFRCSQNSSWTGRLLKELLDDVLNAENCRWDMVWFNVGNWDITPADARFIRKNPAWGFTDGKPKTSIPDYETNMAEIVRRIRKHSPNVKLVFTTTTHIPKVGAEGVEAFNRAAIKVMNQNDVPVFDLYTATKPHVDLLLYKDNTHFSKVANETVIGPHVAAALKSFIATGSLPAKETVTTLSIPSDMIPTLEKDRDLGHPKQRGKKKK